MSDACCVQPSDETGARRCPISGSPGRPVKWTTMVALSLGKVPPRQEVSLCLDADCEVVYFGDRGLELRSADVRTVPGFKQGSDHLACHCFLHSRDAIEQEVRAQGSSPTLEFIRTQVKEKNCACELRNPTGKCCLREIQQIVDKTATTLTRF